jgi:hypothetical protein
MHTRLHHTHAEKSAQNNILLIYIAYKAGTRLAAFLAIRMPYQGKTA